MPSIFQFLQNPQLFVYESTLNDNPEILNALIDYLTKNPDPLIHNDQQCYVYPNKAADILSLGTTYRPVIAKRERKNKKTNEQENYYPYLDRMFRNLQNTPNLEQSLLGYTNKVLISFAKKTPEIYEYIKDNQQVISCIIKNNNFLRNLKEFWVTFLVESTMGLYVFLKNVVIRGLMFRIIDETDAQNLVVYEALNTIYYQISKKLKTKTLPQDEKQQLQQICVNYHDEDFVTLIVLKISSKKSNKTYFIGKLLNQMLSLPDQKVSELIATNHMEAIQQYFESYEDSSDFMDCIMADQLEILKLLLNLSEKGSLEPEHQANLMKRLLVYTSIHKRNSILHNILFKLIQIVTEADRTQVFGQINVIPFLIKNQETKGCKYALGSLIWKICQFWKENDEKLGKFLDQNQKSFVSQQVQRKNKKFANLTFYKQCISNMSQLVSQKSHQESSQKQEPKIQENSSQPQTQQQTQ